MNSGDPELAELLSDVESDLAIDRANLDAEMSQHASRYFWYALLHNRYLRAEKAKRLELEAIETRIYGELEVERSRVTERMLKSRCHKDREWLACFREWSELRDDVDLLESVCKAFEHRRSMLVSIGMCVREELRGDLRVKRQEQ